MKQPDVAAVLTDHADRLLTRIVPQLTGFDANSVAMIGMMLHMVAEDYDRAAAMRVEENRAIRALFREAAPLVAGTDLGTRISALAADSDDDLRVSVLETANDALRGPLAELHALVETRDDARGLNDAIWVELARSVERRRVGLANF